jgi:hypothetical protein
MPKILGVDVARQGDDRSVIICRQGRRVRILGTHHGLDTVEVAERCIVDTPAENGAVGIINTKPDVCTQHGPYVAQQIMLQLEHKVRVPHWLPCPKCREQWAADQKTEDAFLKRLESRSLIAGEPGWSNSRLR